MGQTQLTLSIPEWTEGNVARSKFQASVLNTSWSGILIANAWWIGVGIVILFALLFIGIRKKRSLFQFTESRLKRSL
jgi:hypothetical protein